MKQPDGKLVFMISFSRYLDECSVLCKTRLFLSEVLTDNLWVVRRNFFKKEVRSNIFMFCWGFIFTIKKGWVKYMKGNQWFRFLMLHVLNSLIKSNPKLPGFPSGFILTLRMSPPAQLPVIGHILVQRLGMGNENVKHASCLPVTTC